VGESLHCTCQVVENLDRTCPPAGALHKCTVVWRQRPPGGTVALVLAANWCMHLVLAPGHFVPPSGRAARVTLAGVAKAKTDLSLLIRHKRGISDTELRALGYGSALHPGLTQRSPETSESEGRRLLESVACFVPHGVQGPLKQATQRLTRCMARPGIFVDPKDAEEEVRCRLRTSKARVLVGLLW